MLPLQPSHLPAGHFPQICMAGKGSSMTQIISFPQRGHFLCLQPALSSAISHLSSKCMLQCFTYGTAALQGFLEESLLPLSENRHERGPENSVPASSLSWCYEPQLPWHLRRGSGAGQKALFDVDSPPVHTYPPADFSSTMPIKTLTLQSESRWP